MSARSISTTFRPSCAAPAATTRPAEPAPTTQTSGVRVSAISRRRLARAQMSVENGHQREHRETEQGQQDAPLEDYSQFGHFPAVEQQAEPRADARIDDRPGNDAAQGRHRSGTEGHGE